MKNLKLLYSKALINDLLQDASILCTDPESRKVFFPGNNYLYWVDNEMEEVSGMRVEFGMSKKTKEESKESKHTIVSMAFLAELQSICIVLRRGDILMCSIFGTTECVGVVSSGISAAVWSPDEELLVILTCSGNLVIMTKDFDVLTEQDMQPSEFGECSPITVGWGSKETQFHGSEGKHAAKVKSVAPDPAWDWDDRLPRISWRGDGEFFVTSSIDNELGCRKLRIWNREGSLCYTSEDKNGLEHPLCWKPSGSLIASTRQLPNKHEVVFFEKNGLQHGEFTLPFSPSSFFVKEVLWNMESSILAVWGHEMADTHHYKITIWTVSNYHWHLKQNLDFNKGSEFVIKYVSWDSYNPYLLHVLASGGHYYQYSWAWTYNHSSGISATDDVCAAVIDNCDLRLTPFKKTIVPPPMCSYSFTCPSSINHITFSPFSEDFCVALDDKQLLRFSKVASGNTSNLPEGLKADLKGCNGFRSVVMPHLFAGAYSISNPEELVLDYPNSFCHFTWLAPNSLLYIAPDASGKVSSLFSVQLPPEDSDPEVKNLSPIFMGTIKERVIGIATNQSGTVAAIQLASGKILRCENSLLPWLEGMNPLVLPHPCPKFSLHEFKEKNIVLGLTDRFILFGNGKKLIGNCTSYIVHENFLITTSFDSVNCYSMYSVLITCEGDISVSSKELSCLSSQMVEKGARIVASVPGDTKVILQAPRGNLEVIHPRPLVLLAISEGLRGLQYKKAFDLAKEHRIDFNVLYDHNPQMFLKTVKTFVEDLNSPTDVNLFLVSLCNENIGHKLYSFQYPEPLNDENFTRKRDLVCEAIHAVIHSSFDCERYFETLIATSCQRSTPDLEKALTLIKEKRDEVNCSTSQSLAEKGMKFLLWLVDIRDLYKDALGMYDFSLAVMVAEKSNMDPKEYLPFLNELRALDDNYRNYKIDMHLQRYKKALNSICKCEDRFDECMSLIKDHRLYTSALNLFPPGSSFYKAVWTAYGDYLMSKHYYKEAALVYHKSENFEEALKAYREGGEWRLALSVAHELKYPKEKIILLSQSLALRLKELQNYEEAALLLERYAQEIENSILILIEGHMWDSAVNLISEYQRPDFIQMHLIPGMHEHQQKLLLSLAKMRETFGCHFERLKVVRQQKASKTQNDDFHDNTDDSMSDTSSLAGSSRPSQTSDKLSGSLVTRKSSRSKRKIELKKYRLKEGSPNEEMALMVELKALVTEIDQLKDGLFGFLKAMVQFDLLTEAREVQTKMKEVISVVEKAMPCIWTTQKPASDVSYGPDFNFNALHKITQQQIETIKLLSDPALRPPDWRIPTDLFLQLLD